jgi:hypothetical protein
MDKAIGHSRLRTALFAALFFVLSSLQPGLFATANATGSHADGGMALSMQDAAAQADDAGPAGRGSDHASHGAAADDDGQGAQHHHKSKDAKDKSCEIHCAPVLAVPVDCPMLKLPSKRCFASVVAARLRLDDYAELIHPPRSLI